MNARARGRGLQGAGWILAAAAALFILIIAWLVRDLVRDRGAHAIGDGRDPATYGFDLSQCLVPREEIVASGMPRDGLPAMDLPAVIDAGDVDPIRRERHASYLVTGDRVIGVVVGGRARAYPLRVLNWHEVANDTLGGIPIAVTYSPLCDAVVVFDRRVRGRTLRFGLSGLLYNSNTLLYDEEKVLAGARPVGVSLWSQLQFRAVAGPACAAGESLTVVPSFLVTWGDWRRAYPETTVLAPENTVMFERYKTDVYGSYFGSGRLRFPVRPLPPEGSASYKSRIMVKGNPPACRAIAADDLPAVDPATAYSLWFAWYAMHPGATRASR